MIRHYDLLMFSAGHLQNLWCVLTFEKKVRQIKGVWEVRRKIAVFESMCVEGNGRQTFCLRERDTIKWL